MVLSLMWSWAAWIRQVGFKFPVFLWHGLENHNLMQFYGLATFQNHDLVHFYGSLLQSWTWAAATTVSTTDTDQVKSFLISFSLHRPSQVPQLTWSHKRVREPDYSPSGFFKGDDKPTHMICFLSISGVSLGMLFMSISLTAVLISSLDLEHQDLTIDLTTKSSGTFALYSSDTGCARFVHWTQIIRKRTAGCWIIFSSAAYQLT